MSTTYHVQHRYGFVGDYDDTDRLVLDCRDAVIYTRIGAVRVAEKLNERLGELDRKAKPVMLTNTGKVRIVHGCA
jgi:hypothetical protein